MVVQTADSNSQASILWKKIKEGNVIQSETRLTTVQ